MPAFRMEETIEWPLEFLKDSDSHRRLILAYYAARYYLKLDVETIRRKLQFKIVRTMHDHRRKAVSLLTHRINQRQRAIFQYV